MSRKKLTMGGESPRRGARLGIGKGWRLINVKRGSVFTGAITHIVRLGGGRRIALVSIAKERA